MVKTPWVGVSSHHYTLWMIQLWCNCCLPDPLGPCSNWRWALTSIYIVIPLPFWHKLNYFLFCQTFEKKKIICGKILINLKVQLLGFELQTLNDNDFKLSKSKHITLSHNLNKILFIILYNHYLKKKFKIKKIKGRS